MCMLYGTQVCSPEYNHSLSPAIANTFGHFGGSIFAWKPSAIVTYSIGRWVLVWEALEHHGKERRGLANGSQRSSIGGNT